MTPSEPAGEHPVADRVRRAIADESVGSERLYVGLAELGGIGDINVSSGRATVTVTLPVPSRAIQEEIEGDFRRAVLGVDDVTGVECVWDACAADPGTGVDIASDVKNVITVASGKGGVGKSTVAVNLAVALADAGAEVGLLDADVYGPNAPAMLGLSDQTPDATRADEIRPRTAHGVSVMSMGFIVGEEDPVIWRGPIVDEFLKQLFDDVQWGELDYLIVDLPPGTGDTHLTMVQYLPVTGAIVVTTPQQVAVDDAKRGLRGFARYDVPILGIVENMSRFECPNCEAVHEIFDSGGASELSAAFDVPVLGRLPLDSAVGTLEADEEDDELPGISVPGLGRLQLPRTREEREEKSAADPIAVRDGGGEARAAFEEITARTAARVNHLATTVLQDDESEAKR